MPKLQIACNTQVTEGMVVQTDERQGQAGPPHHARVPARQPPDRLPGLRPGRRVLPAGPVHGRTASTTRRSSSRRRSTSARSWTSGPIMLDAERCVLCSRCLRFEEHVTGTNTLRVREPRRPHADRDLRGPAHHPRLRGQPGRRLPGGRAPVPRLPLQDARLVPEVHRVRLPRLLDRLQHRRRPARRRGRTACGRGATSRSTSPGCATSGASSYKEIASRHARHRGARAQAGAAGRASVAVRPRRRGREDPGRAARLRASWPRPRPRTRTLFAFKRAGRARRAACSTSGSAIPQDKAQVREDNVLLRADRNPNTQGCLDQGLGVSGVDAILKACAAGTVKVLVLQGPELLKDPGVAAAARQGPVRGRDGHARGPGARPRARRAARRGVGGGGRARSRTTSAACSASSARSRPRATRRAALGARRGTAHAPGRAALGARPPRDVFAHDRARRRRSTPASTTRRSAPPAAPLGGPAPGGPASRRRGH